MNEPELTNISGAALEWGRITGGDEMTILQPFCFRFEPEPDITAYELARLMPYLTGTPIYQSTYDAMGSERRHLKV